MADLKVKITSTDPQPDQALDDNVPAQEPEKKKQLFTVKVKARRTLDGNIIVSDHPDIDIVIMPDKMRVITF